MSGDFGMFDEDDVQGNRFKMSDIDGLTTDDIETVLNTMRHLSEHELQHIRENLLQSLPSPAKANTIDVENIDWTSKQMIILHGITFLMFLAFGKNFRIFFLNC